MTDEHTEYDYQASTREPPPTLAELVTAIDEARDAWHAATANVTYHQSELGAAVHRAAVARDALERTLARYDADRNQATT